MKNYFYAACFLVGCCFSCQTSTTPEKITAQGNNRAKVASSIANASKMELSATQWKADDTAWKTASDANSDGWPASALVATDGDGLLFVDAAQMSNQTLLSEHGDIELELEYMLGPETNFGLYLQGNYRIDLSGAAGALYSGQAAGAEGQEIYQPILSADYSPGLWQKLRLVFQAPSFSDTGEKALPAKLNELYLNGNLIQYQRDIYAPTSNLGNKEQAQGPLLLWAENGQAAVRNIAYRSLKPVASYVNDGEAAVLNLPQINYTYYELNNSVEKVPNLARLNASKRGKIGLFDIEAIKTRNEQYAIQFTADLEIPQSGTYLFFLRSDDGSNLYVDGELLIDNDGIHANQEKRGRKMLSAGTHSIRVDFFQGGGGAGLSLAYRSPGGEKQYLNSIAPEKVSDSPMRQQMVLTTDEDPYLLRSFLFFPLGQTKAKRTHALSVGETDGPHYTVDLASGSMLMAWEGPFLNTADMWNGRGIQQVVNPLGGVVSFSEDPQWAKLANPEAAWPDTLNEAANFQHQRYELDEQGRPTFFYQFGKAEFSDRITPGEDRSVSRQVKLSQSDEGLYYLLARAKHIVELSENTYRIDDNGSYVLQLKNLKKAKLYLRDEGQTQALVAQIKGNNSEIDYQLYW